MRVTPGCEQIELNVVGSSVFGVDPKISVEKTYNMFESDGFLVNFAGYQRALDVTVNNTYLPAAGEGRALFKSVNGNFMLMVVNSTVYKITENMDGSLSSIQVGTLETSTGEVFIDENTVNQICLVDGVNAYIYNYAPGGGFAKQVGAPLGTVLFPQYVCYHAGFFLFGNIQQNLGVTVLWYVYQPTGALTIAEVGAGIGGLGGQFPIETKPDVPLAVRRIPGQSSNVLVLGRSVGEIWTQVGGTENYRRNSSVSVDYGVASVDTIAGSDNYIAWLGINESNSPVIVLFNGQSFENISTDGIDNQLRQVVNPQKSTALFYRQDGHLFYQLTFWAGTNPTTGYSLADNLTLSYDVTAGKFYNLSDQNLNYHPARQAALLNFQTYFCSLNNGSLYVWDPEITVYNDNILNENAGDNLNVDDDLRLIYEIPRIRIGKTFRYPTTAPFRINQIVFLLEQGNFDKTVQPCIEYLISETGIRLFSEQKVNPSDPHDPGYQLVPEGAGQEDCVSYPYQGRVDLSLSKNGGVTWSNWVGRDMRPSAYFRNIIRWERLGFANEVTPKWRFCTEGPVIAGNGVMDITL